MKNITQIATSAAFIFLLHVLPPCGGVGGAFAQSVWSENPTRPGWVFQGIRGRDYLIPKVVADSAALPTYPLLFTNGTRRDSTRGAIAYAIAENKLYKWSGTAWSSVGGGSSYTDALARAAISLTTTGTSGAATYSNVTGVLNVPQYQAAGSYQPTITYPYTTLKYYTGYGTFGSFYDSARAAISLTTTGTSGAATYNNATGVLNVPNYTGGGITTVGTLQNFGTANAATISGNSIFLHKVSSTTPGLLTTGTDTIAGSKFFNSTITIDNSGGVRIYTANDSANARSGIAITGSSGSKQDFHTFTKSTGSFFWYGGDFQNTSTPTYWMKLSSTGVDFATPFTNLSATLITTTDANGVKLYLKNNGTGFRAGLGITGSGSTRQDFHNFFQSSGTMYWYGGDFQNSGAPSFLASLTTAKYQFNVPIAIDGATINASANLISNSTTKGWLPSRLTTAQRDAIASPATGLTLYCTDCTANDASTGVMQTYNGTVWKNNW